MKSPLLHISSLDFALNFGHRHAAIARGGWCFASGGHGRRADASNGRLCRLSLHGRQFGLHPSIFRLQSGHPGSQLLVLGRGRSQDRCRVDAGLEIGVWQPSLAGTRNLGKQRANSQSPNHHDKYQASLHEHSPIWESHRGTRGNRRRVDSRNGRLSENSCVSSLMRRWTRPKRERSINILVYRHPGTQSCRCGTKTTRQGRFTCSAKRLVGRFPLYIALTEVN